MFDWLYAFTQLRVPAGAPVDDVVRDVLTNGKHAKSAAVLWSIIEGRPSLISADAPRLFVALEGCERIRASLIEKTGVLDERMMDWLVHRMSTGTHATSSFLSAMHQEAFRSFLAAHPLAAQARAKCKPHFCMPPAYSMSLSELSSYQAVAACLDVTMSATLRRAVEVRRDVEEQKRSMSAMGLEASLPSEFSCPITMDVMCDPVVASDGFSYERSAIESHLARAGRAKSPMTRAVLSKTLVENVNLQKRIRQYGSEICALAKKSRHS